jgi:hypothetical protein
MRSKTASPEGTAEFNAQIIGRPLRDYGIIVRRLPPNVETLGYCHTSLRDENAASHPGVGIFGQCCLRYPALTGHGPDCHPAPNHPPI